MIDEQGNGLNDWKGLFSDCIFQFFYCCATSTKGVILLLHFQKLSNSFGLLGRQGWQASGEE
jgi:hypothetical protein